MGERTCKNLHEPPSLIKTCVHERLSLAESRPQLYACSSSKMAVSDVIQSNYTCITLDVTLRSRARFGGTKKKYRPIASVTALFERMTFLQGVICSDTTFFCSKLSFQVEILLCIGKQFSCLALHSCIIGAQFKSVTSLQGV